MKNSKTRRGSVFCARVYPSVFSLRRSKFRFFFFFILVVRIDPPNSVENVAQPSPLYREHNGLADPIRSRFRSPGRVFCCSGLAVLELFRKLRQCVSVDHLGNSMRTMAKNEKRSETRSGDCCFIGDDVSRRPTRNIEERERG